MLKCPFARNSGNHLPNILYRYPIPTLQQQHQVVYIKYCTLSQISQRIGNALKTKKHGTDACQKVVLVCRKFIHEVVNYLPLLARGYWITSGDICQTLPQ